MHTIFSKLVIRFTQQYIQINRCIAKSNTFTKSICKTFMQNMTDNDLEFVKVPRHPKDATFREAAWDLRKDLKSSSSTKPIWQEHEPQSINETFTILSWNILAHCYVSPGKRSRGEFAHIDPNALEWEDRLPRIMAEISECQPDIVCLQEVVFEVYQEELEPLFFSLGYHGLMQDDAKRAPLHRCGNATFWRQEMFEPKPIWESHRSRTMATILRFREGWNNFIDDDMHDKSISSRHHKDPSSTILPARNIAIVNCHLEGDPNWVAIRVRQLQSVFRQVAMSNVPHEGMVVCGDFNCDLGTSASSAYCSFGKVPEGLEEWGVVDKDCQTIGPHGYQLSSAYPFDLENFSYAANGRNPGPGGMVDQFWYTPESIVNLGYRALFKNDQQRIEMRNVTSIRVDNPSDHLPIAACLAWKSNAKEDIGTKANHFVLTEQGGSALAANALTDNAQAKEDPLSLSQELLEMCPISESDKEMWRSVVGPLASDRVVFAGLPPPNKPNKEQLTLLKQHREERENMLKRVGAEAKQILDQVALLEKRAKKKLQQEERKRQQERERKEREEEKAKQEASGYMR